MPYKTILLLIFIFINQINIKSQDIKPSEKEVLANVLVTDFSDKPKAGETIYFIGTNPLKAFSGITDKKGTFSVLLPKNNVYLIKYRNFNDSLDYTEMEVPSNKGLYEFTVQIKIEPPKVYVLEDVFFDFGKATLRKESFKALNNLVEVLNLKSTMLIEISGHTDNIGKPDDNLLLSQKRADAVKDYLIKKGIKSERLVAKGYGDTQPIDDNESEQGRQNNRRTEVRIIKE